MPEPSAAEALAAAIDAMGLGGLTIFWTGTKWQVSRSARTRSGNADNWSCHVHEDLATAIATCLNLPKPAEEDEDDDLAALLGKRRKP